jgi:hypothetical protein
MLRADVNKVDVQAVDLGDEIRIGVQPGLALAPIVIRRPIARECLGQRELNALRSVRDSFFVRPTRRLDPAAKVDQLFLRNIYRKWTDSFSGFICLLRSSCLCHLELLS